MKMPNMCPFEKKEKEVFFRLTIFFSGTKKFCPRKDFFVQFFMYCKAKKNFGVIGKVLKKFFF